MPYRLRISKEEVEAELKKLGFDDVPPEMIESFRADLLKLIKSDLKKLKQSRIKSSLPETFQKANIEATGHQLPSTSTPSSYLELEKERIKSQDESSTSEYESGAFSTSTESSSYEATTSASEISKPSDKKLRSETMKEPSESVRSKEECKLRKESRKTKEELPSYPERPDPVNLYHYYKAHWDKFKTPGEDPRSALRWDVRSKLFYSS